MPISGFLCSSLQINYGNTRKESTSFSEQCCRMHHMDGKDELKSLPWFGVHALLINEH